MTIHFLASALSKCIDIEMYDCFLAIKTSITKEILLPLDSCRIHGIQYGTGGWENKNFNQIVAFEPCQFATLPNLERY